MREPMNNVEIDRLVHEPARLRILGQLFVVETADFLFLMQHTGLTQGNLSSHMARLEAAGYIKVRKEFANKRPRTLLTLTGKGRKALEKYVQSMTQLLSEVASPAAPAKPKRLERFAPTRQRLLRTQS